MLQLAGYRAQRAAPLRFSGLLSGSRAQPGLAVPLPSPFFVSVADKGLTCV